MKLSRWLITTAVVGAVALAGALPGTSSGPRSDAAAATNGSSCPGGIYPNGTNNQPYQLAFSGTGQGTIEINSSPAGPVHLSAVSFSFCGLLELPNNTPLVLPQNIHFSPVSAQISRARLSQMIDASGVSRGGILPTPGANNGLNIYLTAPVTAITSLLGVQCALPVSLQVSTAGTGGIPLNGPLNNANATLAASGFPLNPTDSTGSGGRCPYYLANQIDTTLGLPNTSTSANVAVHLNFQIP